MKVRDLIKEAQISNNKFPEDKKVKLRNKLKDIWQIIDYFEKKGEIHRDDKIKVETFKDFIQDMLKDTPKF